MQACHHLIKHNFLSLSLQVAQKTYRLMLKLWHRNSHLVPLDIELKSFHFYVECGAAMLLEQKYQAIYVQ